MKLRWPQRAQPVLSGDIVTIRLDVTWPEEGPFWRELWSYLDQADSELRHNIEAAVKKHLGPEFEVRSLTFARGSLTVLVVIGTVYYAISRYKSFIESIEALVSHLKDLVRRFFGRPAPTPISVSASWAPGPALVTSEFLAPHLTRPDPSLVMLWYLVVSHAALLGAVFWLLLTRAGRP